MRFITKNVLGVFVVDGEDVIDWEPFDTDPGAIADKMDDRCDEEQQLAEEYDVFEKHQADAAQLGLAVGAIDSKSELYDLQRQVAQTYTRERIQQSHNRDQLLVQATRAIDDLDQLNNSLIERLRPWYSLYFPELEDAMDDHADFADTVVEQFHRDQIDGMKDLADDSTGMDVDDQDREALQQFARQTRQSYQLRDDLETYVENMAERLAPNLSAILGKLLAARMISQAGSLEKLAKMPSSTIQVLGAEKALFRHMRGEGSAPKHGILFMHPKVQGLPESKSGKMARYIANKASIATRLDHFGGDYKGDEYQQELEEKYEEVKAE